MGKERTCLPSHRDEVPGLCDQTVRTGCGPQEPRVRRASQGFWGAQLPPTHPTSARVFRAKAPAPSPAHGKVIPVGR